MYFDDNAAHGLGYIDHAGIYVGGGNVLSAVSEKWGIRTESIAWYEAGGLHFVGGVRYWSSSTPPSVMVTTTSLPNANHAAPYSASLSASGGSAPYSWSLSGGALPTGLSLSSSGVISGVANTIGTASFSVTATDSQGHQASGTLSIAVGATNDELFGRASDGSAWHDWLNAGTGGWSGWGPLGGPSGATLTSDIAVGYNQFGAEELFARASDGSVWHSYLNAGTGGWSGWGPLGAPSGATLTSDIAVGYNQFGAEELFARASDGSVWHSYLNAGTGGWSGWGPLGGPSGATLTSDIAVGYNQFGAEELFARASDGSVWHSYLNAGTGGWSGWGPLGGPSGATLTSDIAVGYNQFGAEELFARASDGSVWHSYLNAGTGGWSGWGPLGGPSGATLTSDIAVGYNQFGAEELFARASDGSVWHSYLNAGTGGWSGWGPLGGPSGATLTSDIAVGYNQFGAEELFARASDGSVWHSYLNAGTGGWSGWGRLGGPSGATLTSDIASSGTRSPTTSGEFVAILLTGSGAGSVLGSAINCPGSCSMTVPQGTEITLTATPASGSSFGGWSGPCSGAGTCTTRLDASETITATFSKNSSPRWGSPPGTISTGTVATTNTTTTIGGHAQARKCVVPRLHGLRLPAVRQKLASAHCSLRTAHRPRHVRNHHTLRVASQSLRPATVRRAGYPVSVTLR